MKSLPLKAPVKDFMEATEILRTAANAVQESDFDLDTIEKRITSERLELRERFDGEDAALLQELNKLRQAKKLLREAKALQGIRKNIPSDRPPAPYKGAKLLKKEDIQSAITNLVTETGEKEIQLPALYEMIRKMTGRAISQGIRQRISQHIWGLNKEGFIVKMKSQTRGEWTFRGQLPVKAQKEEEVVIPTA